MAKLKVYLCTCITVGCNKERTWSEAHGSYVAGVQVSKALYFRHRRLDQWTSGCPSNDAPDDQFNVGDIDTWSPSAGCSRQSLSVPRPTEPPAPPQHMQRIADSDLKQQLKRTTVEMETLVHDLNHIATLINHEILSFSVNGPLCFSNPPNAMSLEYDLRQPVNANFEVDTGPLRLHQQSVLNRAVVYHQDQLIAAFRALEDMQMLEPLRERWNELMQRICQELDRVTRLKMMEWNRQVCRLRSGKDNSVCSGLQAVQVDTGRVLSSFLSDD